LLPFMGETTIEVLPIFMFTITSYAFNNLCSSMLE